MKHPTAKRIVRFQKVLSRREWSSRHGEDSPGLVPADGTAAPEQGRSRTAASSHTSYQGECIIMPPARLIVEGKEKKEIP